MKHEHLSVALDLEINSSEVLVFDGDSVEFIEKGKLKATLKMKSSNILGRPD
jgi:hypothetical protein